MTPTEQILALTDALARVRWLETQCSACGAIYQRCAECRMGTQALATTQGTDQRCGGHQRAMPHLSNCAIVAVLGA